MPITLSAVRRQDPAANLFEEALESCSPPPAPIAPVVEILPASEKNGQDESLLKLAHPSAPYLLVVDHRRGAE
jgi:hypothetical protein